MTRAEMNWKIFRSILPLVALVFFVYYTKSLNPDYTKVEPIIVADIDELFWRFQVGEAEEFINQVIQFDGVVTKIDSSMIILNHRVVLQDTVLKTMQDQRITIKGRCLGYDDLSRKIKLDHVKKITN
tara:strand:+ start:195 stop:575 length:381 start_codon:yes stop_codon:yes gene_type:complete